MKKVTRVAIFLSLLMAVLLVLVAARDSLSQQYFHFTGKVISLHRGNITVQGDKGETMNFAVGRRTIYIPSRLPGVGERVKVTYYFQRGYNVGYQVEINPTPPPPPPPTKKK